MDSGRQRPRRALEDAGCDQEDASFEALRAAITDLAASPLQASSLGAMVDALHHDQGQRQQRYRLAITHVPLLVAHGLTGRAEAGVPVAAAGLAVYIGVDALDDLVDGDIPKYWPDPPSPVDVISSATLLGALGQLMVARIEGPSTSVAIQRELGRTLLAMSAAQSDELAGGSAEVSVDEVRRRTAGKSGAMLEGFAALAALMVGADDEQLQLVRELGRHLATARQITSDLSELLSGDAMADIRNGTVTVPMAYHLATSSPAHQARFRHRVEQSSGDDEVGAELRAELLSGPGLQAAVLDGELACAVAQRDLEQLALAPPAARGLQQLIDDSSPLQFSSNHQQLTPPMEGTR